MRGRATITVLVVTTFFLLASVLTPGGITRNALGDMEFGYFQTLGPSSNNSTFYRTDPNPTSPVAAYGAQVNLDGISQNIYYASDAKYWLACSDFSNESYPSGSQYATIPENATILEVWVWVYFSGYRPAMSLRVSTGGGAFNSTSVASGYGPYFWNVTHTKDWTHDMLVDEQTIVAFLATTSAGVSYYVGYLGFYKIIWEGWHEVEGQDQPPPDPYIPDSDGGADVGYDIAYTNIPGLLGFIGFFGMIAVPAFGVWVARNGQSESFIALFVKILAAWAFCFTMFMYSVAG